MTGSECDQLNIDNDWSLARLNNCHIGVINYDSERTAESIESIEDDIVLINNKVDLIAHDQGFILWIGGIIAVAMIGSFVKLLWQKIATTPVKK